MKLDDERRREVAQRLRGADGDASAMNLLDGLGIVEIVGAAAIGVEVCRAVRDFDGLKDLEGMRALLADLIEPPARTCRMELVNRNSTYDTWRCSACWTSWSENRTDFGATTLDPAFCPNCGAKVTGKREAECFGCKGES